jgi:predicted dinucleotide-binding enzyme
MISGSGRADRISLQAEVLAPGARTGTTAEVAAFANTVVLALPMHRFRELPPDLFAGKVLVDAMNYWPETDGDDSAMAAAAEGTSSVVQRRFPAAHVVKTLNQLGYHESEEYARPDGSDRIAIGVAGDDPNSVRTAMQLIDRLGFHPVSAGPLANGRALEPDGSPYATTYTAAELEHRLAATRAAGRPASAAHDLARTAATDTGAADAQLTINPDLGRIAHQRRAAVSHPH